MSVGFAQRPHASMVYSVAQLYLGATVVCRKPVVPHWDRSGIHLLYSTLLYSQKA